MGGDDLCPFGHTSGGLRPQAAAEHSFFWLKSILNFEGRYIFRNYSILNSLTMHINYKGA
jgi:hypothetical protein